ncbi:terminase [Clostridium intestinale]|uniref:XkdQ/YqbQ family protein n=1 Tax=Clostridium intestinale TaxID=36845 RepID=UPI0028F0835F|nr:terminase [Clostridium intestinale]
MIEVHCLYKDFSSYFKSNITELVQDISISGSKGEAARKAEITLLHSIFDKNHDNVPLNTGAKIWIVLDGKEIFKGIVWEREINSSKQLTITAYDYLIYLLKSSVTYNFQNILVEDGVKKIISDLGIPYKNIEATGVRVDRLIQDATAYDAIMELYTQASKVNGYQYMPICEDTEVSVMKKGTVLSDYLLVSRDSFKSETNEGNIINTSYKDSMENMVNVVKIYGDEGSYIDKVEDSSLFEYYGVIQKVYQKEEDKNPITVAKNMLHGIDNELTVEALGNWSCRTGYAVATEIFYIDNLKKGILYIDGDSHTWDVGTNKYTMTLNLSYKNEMDSREE